MDNKVNDLRYEIKFENCVKDKKALNAALGRLTNWIIKNDQVINFVLFFCK